MATLFIERVSASAVAGDNGNSLGCYSKPSHRRRRLSIGQQRHHLAHRRGEGRGAVEGAPDLRFQRISAQLDHDQLAQIEDGERVRSDQVQAADFVA
jgi:hypothetical protein